MGICVKITLTIGYHKMSAYLSARLPTAYNAHCVARSLFGCTSLAVLRVKWSTPVYCITARKVWLFKASSKLLESDVYALPLHKHVPQHATHEVDPREPPKDGIEVPAAADQIARENVADDARHDPGAVRDG